MRFSIYRFNPEIDTTPYMKNYELDVQLDSDKMFLNALQLIQEQETVLVK